MKILGTTDSINECDCCGRTDLKRTVAIENDNGDLVHYGVVCASHATKIPKKEIESRAKSADKIKKELEREHNFLIEQAETTAWFEFLKEKTGLDSVHAGFTALGGFSKARELFKQSKSK